MCQFIWLIHIFMTIEIEINENVHSDKNIKYEIKRWKAKDQKSGFKFIRIDPDKEDFDIFKDINEILRHIKQSSNQLTKKVLTDKTRMILLRLKFKSDNAIKSKAIKFSFKKYCPIMSKVVWFCFI